MKSTAPKEVIYLDHAAATPVSAAARFAMERFLAEDFYNPSAPYQAGVEVREAYEGARREIAQAIGAKSAHIILTAGATEANELALGGFKRVYAAEGEHPSIFAHRTAERLEEAEVFSVSLVHSETGVMAAMAEIVERVRQENERRGAAAPLLLHVDASQAATTCRLGVARLGVDLMTLNSGKVYGPKQVGALYVRPGVELRPLVRGGGQERGLRSGTENVAGVVGFAKALTLAQEHVEAERKRLANLKNIFKQEFCRQACATPLEVDLGKFVFDGKQQNAGFLVLETGCDAERLVFRLEERGVLVGTGAACAANKREVSKTLGDSALRLSFGKLNDEKNVRQAAKIIAEEITSERARAGWGLLSSKKAKKVIVGLSGGVDSSVAAMLLLEQGYQVKGVFMKNWSRDLPGMKCPWKEDLADAKRIAVQLGIDFEVWDFEKQYFECVVKTFVDGCKKGLTPNPDILCNEWIKFKLFCERAEAEGADLIATGHYAKVEDGCLMAAKDLTKDQTYFLYRMPRVALEKVIFPLGGLLKSEVRQLAEAKGFRTAKKRESMGICFVGEAEIEEFLSQFIKQKPGEIVEQETGAVIGKHKGAVFYTLGQRHGLYLGGGAPYYVVGKDMKKNILYVSRAADLMEVAELEVRDLHLLAPEWQGEKVWVRTRHLGELMEVGLVGELREGGEVKVKLLGKVRRPAGGQSIVFYTEDGRCIGGGFMK